MNTLRTYTLDLCMDGTPISSGYITTSDTVYSHNRAFDNNKDTEWESSHFGAAANGVAYIGYIFSSPKKIAKIRYLTDYYTSSPSGIEVQASNDGNNWVTIQQFDDTPLVEDSWVDLVITSPPTTGYTHWRLLCIKDFKSGSMWTVQEVEMMECTDTNIPIINIAISKIDIAHNEFLGSEGSSGDYSDAYDKKNCFKGDLNATYWQSALKGTELIGKAYIEYRFFDPLRIGKIRLLPVAVDTNVTSLIVQAGNTIGYDNIQQFDNIVTVPGQWIELNITAPRLYYTTYTDWKLLANSTTSNGYWQVGEIEFYESKEVTPNSCMIITK